ncbi:hypothetical protein SUGI_1151510 [Cryptomeria japonica]|nr:hypothetical protein SUGI_1151510 [Cryptomeria japonica]
MADREFVISDLFEGEGEGEGEESALLQQYAQSQEQNALNYQIPAEESIPLSCHQMLGEQALPPQALPTPHLAYDNASPSRGGGGTEGGSLAVIPPASQLKGKIVLRYKCGVHPKKAQPFAVWDVPFCPCDFKSFRFTFDKP